MTTKAKQFPTTLMLRWWQYDDKEEPVLSVVEGGEQNDDLVHGETVALYQVHEVGHIEIGRRYAPGRNHLPSAASARARKAKRKGKAKRSSR